MSGILKIKIIFFVKNFAYMVGLIRTGGLTRTTFWQFPSYELAKHPCMRYLQKPAPAYSNPYLISFKINSRFGSFLTLGAASFFILSVMTGWTRSPSMLGSIGSVDLFERLPFAFLTFVWTFSSASFSFFDSSFSKLSSACKKSAISSFHRSSGFFFLSSASWDWTVPFYFILSQ